MDVVKIGDKIVGFESKVGKTGLTRGRTRQQLARDIWLLRSRQLDEIVWEFSRSARTCKIGPSGPLLKKLKKFEELGIKIRITDVSY